MKILHTQVGFRPAHAKKHVIFPDLPEARGVFGDTIFWVMEQNEFSKHALNAPEQPDYTYRATASEVRGDFGSWLVGDISSLQKPGVYQVILGSQMGPTFVIRDDVYRRLLPFCLEYFRVQSCGRAVPGWHEACHLDDGYLLEEDRYVRAAGGWHDAGDFRKWASSTSMIAFSLLIADRLWSGREESLGVAPGIFLQEAMQGYEYFLNLQQADGSLLHNIGGGAHSVHDNDDCRYTDNIPESGDERRIHPGAAMPPGKYTALYAMYAEALASRDPERSARALAAAERALAYDLKQGDVSTTNLQWRAWACLMLFRVTDRESYREQAVGAVSALLQLQVRSGAPCGFWREGGSKDGFHRKHVGNDYMIWVLGEFIDSLPEHPERERWRDAVRLWVEGYAQLFVGRNPFGLLPFGLYEQPSPEHPDYHYRAVGDGLYFRYFLANEGRISNARCSLSAAALAAAARVLGRPELLSDAYRLLEWTLGANPFGVCTMTGPGVCEPDPLSFQMGRIPGGVTLGPGGDRDDMPCYKHPRSCTDEYYGYQTSQFMWAMLALEAMEWPV